jgi:hypothetical protein
VCARETYREIEREKEIGRERVCVCEREEATKGVLSIGRSSSHVSRSRAHVSPSSLSLKSSVSPSRAQSLPQEPHVRESTRERE